MRANPTRIATTEKRTVSFLTSMQASLSKRTGPQLRWNWKMMMCMLLPPFFPRNLLTFLCSIEITPPPTPSPVKAAGGKKRVLAGGSDEEDVFVPRYDILSLLVFNMLFVLMTSTH